MKINNAIIILFTAALLILNSCSKTDKTVSEKIEASKTKGIKEHTTLSVLWLQNAAEYKALCHQAFNIAAMRLKEIKRKKGVKYAIVTDIDETVLDNSPYSAMQIKKDIDFNRKDWITWGKMEHAKALPGAVDFFKVADSLGFSVFYISNRWDVQLQETINNLKIWKLPDADAKHVFLKKETSAKQKRRNQVLENYEVVLYLGDNLSDFSAQFDLQGTIQRNRIIDSLRNDFGSKFIVFPNPMYGDWESKGIYENNRGWTNLQKDSIRKTKLIDY